MSNTEVSRFVTRALDDENLRQQLEDDPDAAFQGYDLDDDEKQAIKSAEEQKLQHMGIDAMTARSWRAFHDVEEFAPDRPDASGDLQG
jgi:hypothetical protein